jgi:hypothetical protein
MNTAGRIGVVVAGYVLAAGVASGAVALNGAAQRGVDRSGGMSAFGDLVLFLAVFAVAAIPASSAGLYFLRGQGWFWSSLAALGPAIALTGVAASAIFLGSGDAIGAWSLAAVLRILAAPICAIVFFLAGLFAPKRPWRLALLLAATVEGAAFGAVVLGVLLRAAGPSR